MNRTRLNSIIEAADLVGDALVIYDAARRVDFANDRHRALYPFIDFDTKPSFEDFFRQLHDNGLLLIGETSTLEAEIQRREKVWTSSSRHFRRRLGDGTILLIRHIVLEDGWVVQTRTDVTVLTPQPIADQFDEARAAAGDRVHPASEDQNPLLVLPEALDAVRLPVALVDADLKITYLNHAMGEMLDREDLLQLVEGRLVARHLDFHRRYRLAVRRYARTTDRFAQQTFRIPDRKSGHTTIVAVRSASRGLKPSNQAVVSVIDTRAEPLSSPRRLQQVFELTPAEAEIALTLASGATLGEIAKGRNASISTVRNQLKNVFWKMNARRQSDVIRLVFGLAALG
ncbi:MAG: PAS-domain containing protein [Azospirillaceae bacterium]